MQLGIGSYTFAWAVGVPGTPPERPLTPMGLLLKAKDLGVRVVQFCDNLPLTALSKEEVERVVSFASEQGMNIEIGMRGIANASLLQLHLDLARRFQSPFLRIVLDSKGHEPTPEETISLLRPWLPRFAEAGVRLAIENHDRFTSSSLARMVEELGPDQVGICLDTVNSFGALEGPEVVATTLAPYTLNLHVKDFTIARVSSQMGFVINGAPAGQGRLDLPWLLSLLQKAGRDVNAILELWTPFGPDLEETITREAAWAAASIAYLRQLIPH